MSTVRLNRVSGLAVPGSLFVHYTAVPISFIDFEVRNWHPIQLREFASVTINPDGSSTTVDILDIKSTQDVLRVRSALTHILKTSILAGYNIQYDWNVIRKLGFRIPARYIGIDVLRLVRKYDKQRNNKLYYACKRHGIQLDPHIALNDVLGTLALLKVVAEKYKCGQLHHMYLNNNFTEVKDERLPD